jgi:hypothetical protein
MNRKTAKKPPKPKPRAQQLAESLHGAMREAAQRVALLSAKATVAKTIWDNGASLESVAEKLGWPLTKLERLLEPEVDIPLRTLADVLAVLGREARFHENIDLSGTTIGTAT